MTALRPAACAAVFLLLCGEVIGECGATLSGATRTIEGAQYTVVFRTVPDPIKMGAHFALDFAVCPRASAPAPTAVRVDANMPLHRHGMNYRPAVTAQSNALFRAEGLLFHMPGRWDLTFDVDAAGRTERLTSTVQLE